MSFESWYLQLKFDTLLKPLRSKFGPLEVAELTKIQGEKKNFVIEGVAFQLPSSCVGTPEPRFFHFDSRLTWIQLIKTFIWYLI